MFTKQEECGNVTVGSESLIASEPAGGRCRHAVSREACAGLRCSLDTEGGSARPFCTRRTLQWFVNDWAQSFTGELLGVRVRRARRTADCEECRHARGGTSQRRLTSNGELGVRFSSCFCPIRASGSTYRISGCSCLAGRERAWTNPSYDSLPFCGIRLALISAIYCGMQRRTDRTDGWYPEKIAKRA